MKITPKKYAQALAAVLEKESDPKAIIANFLSILRRRKHFRLLPKILKAFEKEWADMQGVVKMEIEYPAKFKNSLDDLREKLALKFGKTDIKANPSDALIGGFKVIIGDTLIDVSLEGKLRRLASQLNS